MNDIPQYGLKTVFADNHVFYTDFSSRTRLEISLEIGDKDFKKVKFLFQELASTNDGKKKEKDRVEMYFEPNDLLGEFIPLINTGRLKALSIEHLKKSVKNLSEGKALAPYAFFTRNGGTRDKRGQGVAEYREIKLERSNLNDQYWNSEDPKLKAKSKQIRYVMHAVKADGLFKEQGSSGQALIIPKLDSNKRMINASKISFPLTEKQLYAIANAILIELQAYRTSQYITVDITRQLLLLSEKLDQLTVSKELSDKQADKAPQSSVNEQKPEVNESDVTNVNESDDIEDFNLDISSDELPF